MEMVGSFGDRLACMEPALASELDRRLSELASRAPKIPFVALVEHLERLLEGSPPVGSGGLARDEVLRFRHDPSLVFHASDVVRMHVEDGHVVVTSSFLGATGSVSPLASFFSEDVLHADAQDGSPLGRFYDVFHHRLLALCYRALQRPRVAWTVHEGGADAVTGRFLASAGLWPTRPDAALSSLAMLGRSRILARRPRSRQALEAALALAFPALNVEVVDVVARSTRVADEHRLKLGRTNHRLGVTTRLGRNMMGRSDLVRLKIGPVDRATFDSFLPGEKENLRLRRLLDDVTGGMLDAELDLELRRGEEPRASLGRRGSGANPGASLGRSALLLRSGKARSVIARIPLDTEKYGARPRFFQVAIPSSTDCE